MNIKIIMAIILALGIGVGYYLGLDHGYERNKGGGYDGLVACTMDAMQCPDGSYVGRTGPKCEFVCPK